MPKGLVGAGNFIVDFVKTVDRYPAEQTLANISGEARGGGGAPYNVLKDLAALGVDYPLAAIGRVGDDELGRWVLDDCASSGIDSRLLRVIPGVPTSYTLVMTVEANGRRTFFHQRGANAGLAVKDFDFSGFEGWHLHFGYLLLLDSLDAADVEYGTGAARVLAAAKEAGLTVSVDLVSADSDRFGSVVRPALRYADVVFMNEFELERTTGIDVMPGGELNRGRLADAAAGLGCDGPLVLHWQEGAAWVRGSESVVRGSVELPSSDVVSLAGCGDAFAAGFLLAHLRGESPETCLDLGACSAAACATALTCTEGVCDEVTCLALGKRYGFRRV